MVGCLSAGTRQLLRSAEMRLVVVLPLMLLWVVPVEAEMVMATAPVAEDFSESYDPAPLTSGLPLVGLRVGSASMLAVDSPPDLGDVRIALPDAQNARLCIRVTTQDARYTALNPYTIDNTGQAIDSARLDTLTNAYSDILKSYSKRNLAIKAYLPLEDGCSPVNALHVPELTSGVSEDSVQDTLELRVNTRGRDTQVSLFEHDNAEAIATSTCDVDRSIGSLAYDKVCQLPLQGIGNKDDRQWLLALTLNDGFADTRYDFTVYIPSVE